MDEGEIGGNLFGCRWLQKDLGEAWSAGGGVVERAILKRALRYYCRGQGRRGIDIL